MRRLKNAVRFWDLLSSSLSNRYDSVEFLQCMDLANDLIWRFINLQKSFLKMVKFLSMEMVLRQGITFVEDIIDRIVKNPFSI